MYVALWEFLVHPAKRIAFLSAYGADGEWVQLFRLADGYLGTELWQDETEDSRFLTVDRWESREHFDRFQGEFGDPYHALDARLEGLTLRETRIGSFVS